jgi:hypothetical protein
MTHAKLTARAQTEGEEKTEARTEKFSHDRHLCLKRRRNRQECFADVLVKQSLNTR